MSKSYCLLIAIVFFGIPSGAMATVIGVDVSFTAPGYAQGFPDDAPQDPITGAFSFEFDDGIFAGGVEHFVFTPTFVDLIIAGHAYSPSETGVQAGFNDGSLRSIIIWRAG